MALTRDQAFDMLQSARFSDFTILCKDHVFKVHRFALYPKSPFFARCIDGGFKESQEAILTLNDHQPFVVAHMILHAYYGFAAYFETIKLLWPNLLAHQLELVEKEPQHWSLLHYIDLYDFATYLMYGEVQAHAKYSVVNAVRGLLNNVIDDFQVSSTSTTGEVEMIVRVLSEIYTRIPAEEGGLRAEVTALCLSRWHELQRHHGLQLIIGVVEKLEPFGSQIGERLRLEEDPDE